MPLHLAHHKSYHVYNQANIDRVRADEEKARLEEEGKEARGLVADSEARLRLLREQRGQHSVEGKSNSRLKAAEAELDGKRGALDRHDERQLAAMGRDSSKGKGRAVSESSYETRGHINFWADIEGKTERSSASGSSSHKRTAGGNKDYEADKKAEAAKFEEQVTMFLGKPAKELHPWYNSADLKSGEERKKTEEQRLEVAYKDSTIKSSHDPLRTMSSFLAKRSEALAKAERARAHNYETPTRSIASPPNPSHSGRSSTYVGRAREDEGPSKRQRVEASSSSSRNATRSATMASPDGDPLRTARLAREASERARAEALIAAKRQEMDGGASSVASTPRTDVGSYSDQYYREDVREAHRKRESEEDHTVNADSGIGDLSEDDMAAQGRERSHGDVERGGKGQGEIAFECKEEPMDAGDLEGQKQPASSANAARASDDSAPQRDQDRDDEQKTPHKPIKDDASPPKEAGSSTASPLRPFKQESMYVELFQEMVCTVLAHEHYLFSNEELDLLQAYFEMEYTSRYLSVRLLQRKRDAWHRLDRLDYPSDIADMRATVRALCKPITEPRDDAPKIEVAREEAERRRAADVAKENEPIYFTIAPGQCSDTPRTQMGAPRSPLLQCGASASNCSEAGVSNGAMQPTTPDLDQPLSRFAVSEADMKGGAAEALELLSLDELKSLGKKMKVKGTTRRAIITTLLSTSKTQTTLFGSMGGLSSKENNSETSATRQLRLNFDSKGNKSSQAGLLMREVSKFLGGGCVRLALDVRNLIDRVGLVFYRSTMPTDKALTTAVLSRSRRRHYPVYGFTRCCYLFPSRTHLVEYERAIALEARMEEVVDWAKTKEGLEEGLRLFESVWDAWTAAVKECQELHEGVDRMTYHRMRFHAGWPLTRVMHKGTACLARFKMYDREKEVLRALLAQRVFRRGRRGDWYDRLALIVAMYSEDKVKGKKEALEISISGLQDPDTHLIYHSVLQRRVARLESQLRVPKSEQHDFGYARLKVCTEKVFEGVRLDSMVRPAESGVGVGPGGYLKQSPSPSPTKRPRKGSESPAESPGKAQDIFAGYQARTPLRKEVKIERVRKANDKVKDKETGQSPSRRESLGPEGDRNLDLDPDLATADSSELLAAADDPALAEPKVERTETRASMRTVWRGLDGEPCYVEQLCLQHYALQGFKGFHCEGGILTMLFALVMWDVLFLPIEGAFETPYQRAPLDLGTDAFAIARASQIRERLDAIEAGEAVELIREADERERPHKTWAVGCRWEAYEREDLLEIAECMGGKALAVICQMFCEEWDNCTGGMPDLCIWNTETNAVRFVEVKGPGDRLSETQKVWIDVLLRAGLSVELGLVVEAGRGKMGAVREREVGREVSVKDEDEEDDNL